MSLKKNGQGTFFQGLDRTYSITRTLYKHFF